MSAEYMTGLYEKYKDRKGRKLAFSYINKDNAVVKDGDVFWLETWGAVSNREWNAIVKAIKEDFGLQCLYDME